MRDVRNRVPVKELMNINNTIHHQISSHFKPLPEQDDLSPPRNRWDNILQHVNELKQKRFLSNNEHERLINFDKLAKSITARQNTEFSDQL